jgi:Txe/YoeB family toxin of toxin-antitoxin system
MRYRVKLLKRARKDYEIAKRAGYAAKIAELLNTVRHNPTVAGNNVEKLRGYANPTYSRRIDFQNRFVYDVCVGEQKDEKTGEMYQGLVRILSMWGHYG